MTRAPLTTAAYAEFLDTLAAVRDDYVLAASRGFDELETVEAFRYALQLVSEGHELFAEADPERPRFSSIVHPARKFLGDNPDSIYHQAVIRGDRAYRVSGVRTGQTYISFTVHGPDPAGGINGPVLADVNDRDLTFAPDGSFSLVLSSEPRPAGHDGDWITMDPSARTVIVRNYFLRERSVQTDPAVHVHLDIEPVADPGPPPPLDDATFARRLRDATAFVHATTLGLRVFGTPATVPFVSNEPNTVATPWSFRSAGVDAAGAVDIFYSSGAFDLGPDQAMVMEGTLPSGAFTNVMLWNVHMQTLEYRGRRSSLNSAQTALRADGSYRIVIAGRDPGVANWLDTGGHRRGTIFWRFLLPDEQPATPRCRVVPVDQVASLG